ncbi:MAG TPA: GGDEF domain-containing protein [Kofleriaceae bacterium]|nr:GGDEF domain-containing protein [Kofleriaceae bacterium]
MAQAGRTKKRRGSTVVLDDPPGGAGGNDSGPEEDAYIILLHPPGTEMGWRTTLELDRYLVGRDEAAEIFLARESVSRQHAELRRDVGGHWMLRDLGSTNGSFVNDRRVSEVRLRDGDQIKFGDVVYKFLSGGNVEHRYHEEIYQMSVLDALTGVYNRRFFNDFLERERASAQRHRNPLTLVMLDIDHFKEVNDQRGHLCGDAALRQVADRIKPRIRREDLFARFGGEEFAAILTITPLEGGLRFAESLRQIVARRPFVFDGEEFPMTISLGVTAMIDEPDLTTDALIQRADALMYEAKRLGRDRVCPVVPPRASSSNGE